MGSKKFHLVIAIILVYEISTIDTQSHAEKYPADFRRSSTGRKIIDASSEGIRLAAGNADLSGSKSVALRAASLNKHDAKNSYSGNESVLFSRHRRSIGGSGQTGSQSLCNKQGCSCSDQPILTIDCDMYDEKVGYLECRIN